jgi:rod shape-determining protein MreD
MEKILNRIVWFIGLLLVQILLFNKIYLFGLATPFIYVYFILVLDKEVDRNALMLQAFALGLMVDVFCNTPGVNAGASVLLAFTRARLLRMFMPREEYENFEPGIRTMGVWPFLRYAFVAVLLHHSALFMLEAFSLAHIGHLLLRVLCSTLLTVMLVMSIELVRQRH